MEISDLTAYAEEKYHIQEEYKWTDFPGFSVLCHPDTGKWAVLLMRQWDSETGTEIEKCDIKCGRDCLNDPEQSYLGLPIRMKGPLWVSVSFERNTDEEVVCRLLDQAMEITGEQGFKIILEQTERFHNSTYQETPILFSRPDGTLNRAKREDEIPERIQKMRQMYRYKGRSIAEKSKIFYAQGKFMEDYEDDYPWRGEFLHYFPTYQDMNVKQLRGYFSWRSQVRKGIFNPIPASAVYVYIYELLNGIGVSSLEETLKKIREFEEGYLDHAVKDEGMRKNLHRWMLELMILHDAPDELIKTYGDPEEKNQDPALTVLKDPDEYTDEEVFSAICVFDKRLKKAAAVLGDERGPHLFSSAWRYMVSNYTYQGNDFFTVCFGKMSVRRWYPLANAIYYSRRWDDNRTFRLNEYRTYRCSMGNWQTEGYDRLYFNIPLFQGFFHEAELKFRKYLNTGHPLKEKPKNAWAAPYLDEIIEIDRKEMIEKSRPKIKLDLSGLDKIRKDAVITRDSLLTDEELTELKEYSKDEQEILPESSEQTAFSEPSENREQTFISAGLPLDEIHGKILLGLLHREDVGGLINQNHLMPSLVADTINEALFDDIGDNVVSFDDSELSLVEDYIEDLEFMLGDSQHE